MKKLRSILFLALGIAAFYPSCKKGLDEGGNAVPPTSITMGVIGSGTCSYSQDTIQYDSDQVFTLQLSERDSLTIKGITTNNGYSVIVVMTDSVQCVFYSDINLPTRLPLNSVITNNSGWQHYSPYVVLSAFLNGSPLFGNWKDGQPGYLAFRVHKADSNWYYGWIHLRANGVNGFTVYSWFFYL